MAATNKIITYVGRKTDFKGKPLWEILGSLKNFGVGRLVTRHVFGRYPEPSSMKILKVETYPNEERRRIKVWVEKIFRGRKLDGEREIFRTTYKPDYQLIPKNEEAKYLAADKPHDHPETILPNSIEMPPLMKKLAILDYKKKGLEVPEELTLPLPYNYSPNRVKRIARPGEKPTIQFSMGLGKPISPSLYEGIKLDKN